MPYIDFSFRNIDNKLHAMIKKMDFSQYWKNVFVLNIIVNVSKKRPILYEKLYSSSSANYKVIYYIYI